MRKLFVYSILTPIMFLSSFILLFHGFVPSIWWHYLRPTVVRIRQSRHCNCTFGDDDKFIKTRFTKIPVFALNKEHNAVIRFIRLVSEGSISEFFLLGIQRRVLMLSVV